MTLIVKAYKDGVGIFNPEGHAQYNPDFPVHLCKTWVEAHEILRWIKDNPQAEFERKALWKLDNPPKPKRHFEPRNRSPNGLFATLDAR